MPRAKHGIARERHESSAIALEDSEILVIPYGDLRAFAQSTPLAHDLLRLTPPERALYDDLRDHRIRPRLRLEQERVGFGWLQAALARLDLGPGGQ